MHADQVIHVLRLGKGLVPDLFIKLCRAAFDLPAFRMDIIMQGQPVRIPMELILTVPEQGFHHPFGPFRVRNIRAAGDLPDPALCVKSVVFFLRIHGGGAILADIGLVAPVFVGIELRRHIAAAAPVLISHAKEVNLPWLRMAILRAQIRHRGNTVERHVLNPFRHLLHSSAAQVPVHIGLASQLGAQLHKLMGTEAVVLHDTAPVRVDHLLAVLLRANPVLPVVLIRKASARPAKNRNADLLQRFHHIASHPIYIRNLRVLTDIQTFVDASPQMLGEMPIDLLMNLSLFLSGIDIIFRHVFSPGIIARNCHKISCAEIGKPDRQYA